MPLELRARERFVRLCLAHHLPLSAALVCPNRSGHPTLQERTFGYVRERAPWWVMWDAERDVKAATVRDIRVEWEPGYDDDITMPGVRGRDPEGFTKKRPNRKAA